MQQSTGAKAESITSVDLSKTSVRMVTSIRAAFARNGAALLGVFYTFAAALSVAFVVLVAMALSVAGDTAVGNALFLLTMLGIGAAVIGLLLVFMWLLLFRGFHVVNADAAGIRYEMRVGPLTLIRTSIAWTAVRELGLEPSSAVGRIRYVTAVGPAFVGIGLDDDTANQVHEILVTWWREAVPVHA